MRKYFWIPVLALVIGAGTWSCEKENAPYGGSGMESERIADPTLEHLIRGHWVVDEFKDQGIDKTSDFAGYVFYYEEGGRVRAESDFGATAGKWMHAANDNPVSFIMEFNEGRPFGVLNREWHITLLTENAFALEYVGDPINQASDLRDVKTLRFKNRVPPELQ